MIWLEHPDIAIIDIAIIEFKQTLTLPLKLFVRMLISLILLCDIHSMTAQHKVGGRHFHHQLIILIK